MPELRIVLEGLRFGESPRWHEGRLWFCDWAAERLMTVDLTGHAETIAEVHSFPFSIDWLPGGQLPSQEGIVNRSATTRRWYCWASPTISSNPR